MDLETKNEFVEVRKEFVEIRQELADIKKEFVALEQRIGEKFQEMTSILLHEIEKIQNNYVTKDYLDKKFAAFAAANNLVLREDGPDYQVK